MRTVTMSAFSRYPRFEPAKTQRRERMNVVKAKRRGRIAGRRMTRTTKGVVASKNGKVIVEKYLETETDTRI